MKNRIILNLISSFTIAFSACSHSDKPRGEEGKIFHAGPSTGGIGSLYFALYSDKTYQICNSGGIGQICYSGNFNLNKDTITLIDLNKDIPLKSSRLVIKRFAEQDSSFWKWKYEGRASVFNWRDFKWQDSVMGGTGNVYQLTDKNELTKNDIHFKIQLDSLKSYR